MGIEVGVVGCRAGEIWGEGGEFGLPLFDFQGVLRGDEARRDAGASLVSRKRSAGGVGSVEEVERTKRRKLHHHHFRSSRLLFLPTSPSPIHIDHPAPTLPSQRPSSLDVGPAPLLANPIRGAAVGATRIHPVVQSNGGLSITGSIRRRRRSLMGPSESKFVGTGLGWTSPPPPSSSILARSAPTLFHLALAPSTPIPHHQGENKGDARKSGGGSKFRLRRWVMLNSWRKSSSVVRAVPMKEQDDGVVARGGADESKVERGVKVVESRRRSAGSIGRVGRASEITKDDLESFTKLINRLLRRPTHQPGSVPHRLPLSPLLTFQHPITILRSTPRPRTPLKPKIVESQSSTSILPPPHPPTYRRSGLQHSICGVNVIQSVISTRFNSVSAVVG